MRRVAAVVLGASLLVLPACGQKTDEAARAAGITPATALAMVSVNLSPSIEQKRNLLAIARRFPDAGDQVKGEFEDSRDGLLQTILADSGLDYTKDVKPWLGSEAAAVVLPPRAGGTPLFLALVQTSDKDQAEAAIAKATRGGDFEGTYAIVDDYVVISDQEDPADNQPAIDQITAQAGKDSGSLADAPDFTKVVDQLHGDRLVLGWVDTAQVLDQAQDFGGFGDVAFLRDLGDASVAFDMHVESKAVVFQGVAAASGPDTGSDVELTRSLPASTLAALTMFDLGGSVTKAIETVTGARGGGSDFIGEIEESTGIDFDEDVLSWMKGEAVVVVGAVRDGQPFPDFALVVEPTDKAKATAGLDKIRRRMTENGLPLEERPIGDATAYVVPEAFTAGVQPAMALFADRFVLANSPAYLGDLATAATPGLGSTDAYASLFGDNDGGTSFQVVILLDPVREALENALLPTDERAGYEADVKPNLEPLSAFAVTVRRDGAYNRFEAKLTLD